MKKRLVWLDVAKGFAILYVLFGHTFPWGGLARDMGESYLMPMYFVVAGYTFKNILGKDVVPATIKDAKRIMVPAIIAMLLDYIGRMIVGNWGLVDGLKATLLRILWGNSYDCSFSIGVGAMWFLYAMFWSRLAYRLIGLVSGNRNWIRILLIALLTAITHYMNLKGLYLPQFVDGVFLGCVFLEVGKCIKEYDKKEFTKKYDFIIGFVSFVLWCGIFFGFRINMIMNSRVYTIVTLFLAIVGSVWTIMMCRLFNDLKFVRPIQWVGQCSLDLLCIHFLDHLWFDGMENGMKLALIRMSVDVIILVIYEFIKSRVFNTKNNTKSCPKGDTK